MLQNVASLTIVTIIIYNHNMFIVQSTDVSALEHFVTIDGIDEVS